MTNDIPKLERLRIGKRIYPVRTTLDEREARRMESLFDSLAEQATGANQEEALVLMVLNLAHALEKTRSLLERLTEREGKS